MKRNIFIAKYLINDLTAILKKTKTDFSSVPLHPLELGMWIAMLREKYVPRSWLRIHLEEVITERKKRGLTLEGFRKVLSLAGEVQHTSI